MTGKIVIIIMAILYTLIASAIGALPALFWGFSLRNYLAIFCILIVVQLFVGKLWNYFVDRATNLKLKQADAAIALADSIQHIEVICSYCGTTNLVKAILGKEDNTYNCEACNQTNALLIETSCARVTKPIMPKAELADIFKNIDNK